MVESTLNYLADLAETPYFYLYEPPPGAPWRWQTASSPQRTSQGGRTTGTSHAAVVSNARKEALISSRGGGAGQLGIWRQRRWRAAFDLKYRS